MVFVFRFYQICTLDNAYTSVLLWCAETSTKHTFFSACSSAVGSETAAASWTTSNFAAVTTPSSLVYSAILNLEVLNAPFFNHSKINMLSLIITESLQVVKAL